MNRRTIGQILSECGLNHFGFCPFSAVADKLIPGHSSRRLPDNPQTVIVFLFPILLPEKGARNVARFAVPPDYHTIVLHRLQRAADRLADRFPGHSFTAFSDSSPLPEVRLAAMAGLGVVGRHNLLITPRFGSWVMLGELVTDLPLDAAAAPVSSCLDCGACLRRCPTEVLCDAVFARKQCLSDVTQRRQAPSPEHTVLLRREGIAWGCDRCQEVCPMNKNVEMSDVPEFFEDAQPLITAENAEQLGNRVYAWRGASVILRNLRIISGRDENTS